MTCSAVLPFVMLEHSVSCGRLLCSIHVFATLERSSRGRQCAASVRSACRGAPCRLLFLGRVRIGSALRARVRWLTPCCAFAPLCALRRALGPCGARRLAPARPPWPLSRRTL
eukprot:8298249-Alexandrium_andersonii.AAC.1